MDGRTERKMPKSQTPFRTRTSDRASNSNAQSSQKSSSSRVLREMEHSNERNSRSHTSNSSSHYKKAPPTSQKVSSSRILNKDGSIPKSTDRLVVRGFEILKEDREKRRRKNELQPRIASDGSSKSSATYVYSPTNDSGSTDVPLSHDNRPSRPVNYSDTTSASSAPRKTHDAKRRLKSSLDSHEANIQAMQAEIAALKRACILTRELRDEATLEEATKLVKSVEHKSKVYKKVERRSADSEALMSGGNGTGDEDTVILKPRAVSNSHVYNESMEGLPTPPQLLPLKSRTKQQTTETRSSQKTQQKQEKRKSSRDKLCLCPNCISVTQQVVNTLVERYAMQKSNAAASSNSSIEHQISIQKSPKKILQIDPKTYHHPCHTTQTNPTTANIQNQQHPKTTTITLAPSHSHYTQKPIPKISSNKRDENQRPESPNYSLRKLKELRDTPCDCYTCRFMANQAEFERMNAPFPPIRNGVWARGRDSRGYWYW